jgi:uncharacterized protein (DUF433 family)
MNEKQQQLLNRITVNPNICHGKTTIRGLRYPVVNLLELMASGMTNQEILADYEDLEEADLQACLLFAKQLKKQQSIRNFVARSNGRGMLIKCETMDLHEGIFY